MELEKTTSKAETTPKSKIVIAAFFQLLSIEGSFTKENPKKIREKVVVERSYVERFNDSFTTSGKLYVIDEKATSDYLNSSKEILAAKKENDVLVKETGNLLKSVVKEGMKAKKIKADDLG